MKAVVMEIKDRKAFILGHDGVFSIIPDQGYTVGQVLDIKPEDLSLYTNQTKAANPPRGGALRKGIAAAACLVLIGGAGIFGATSLPMATVTLDSAVSLNYSLNLLNRVLRLKGYNAAGESAADALKNEVSGRNIDEALAVSMDYLADQGEVSDGIVVTVNRRLGNTEKLQDKVQKSLDDWADRQEGAIFIQKDRILVAVPDQELIHAADEQGISPGELLWMQDEPWQGSGTGDEEMMAILDEETEPAGDMTGKPDQMTQPADGTESVSEENGEAETTANTKKKKKKKKANAENTVDPAQDQAGEPEEGTADSSEESDIFSQPFGEGEDIFNQPFGEADDIFNQPFGDPEDLFGDTPES
ncbi:MAG: hypothetical protein IJ899_20650 [Blautia sp.]|nr:hypothetical protein [Blautia sp.]MBR2561839.1 hypothetical protein [Eubacterium sp.]